MFRKERRMGRKEGKEWEQYPREQYKVRCVCVGPLPLSQPFTDAAALFLIITTYKIA